jgi:hypothetical protein
LPPTRPGNSALQDVGQRIIVGVGGLILQQASARNKRLHAIGERHMAQVTRRFFLLSSAALSAGCATRGPSPNGTPSAQKIRQPVVGQSWRYAKHDLYTHAIIYDEVDHVASIDRYIEIDSNNQATGHENDGKTSWGSALLRKFTGHRDRPAGALPGEVQSPWGMVLVDPHWSKLQVYETPVPLWPAQLRPGWETRVSTHYKTSDNGEALRWDQTMKAHAWETITVPAGRFTALRYTNSIKFGCEDFARKDCTRQETLWFAAEVGRWVARESAGSYYADDSAFDQPFVESGFRWELLEWS